MKRLDKIIKYIEKEREKAEKRKKVEFEDGSIIKIYFDYFDKKSSPFMCSKLPLVMTYFSDEDAILITTKKDRSKIIKKLIKI